MKKHVCVIFLVLLGVSFFREIGEYRGNGFTNRRDVHSSYCANNSSCHGTIHRNHRREPHITIIVVERGVQITHNTHHQDKHTKAGNLQNDLQTTMNGWSNHSQSGQQLIGNGANGLNSFCIRVDYSAPFDIEPIVNVTVCGDGFFDDVCVATVHSSNRHGFSVNIKRAFEEMQSSRWTQNLSLYWIAKSMDAFNGKMMYTDVEEGEKNIVLEIPIDDDLFSDSDSLPRVMVTPVGDSEDSAPYASLQIREIRRDKILLNARVLSCPLNYFEVNYCLSHSTQSSGHGSKSNISYIGDISTSAECFIKRTVRFPTSYPVPPHIVVVPVSDPHNISNDVVAVNVQTVTAKSFTAVIRKFEHCNKEQNLYLHYYTQIPRDFENAIDTSELFTNVVSSWNRPSLPILVFSPSKSHNPLPSLPSITLEANDQSFLDRSNLENFDILEEAGLIKETQESIQENVIEEEAREEIDIVVPSDEKETEVEGELPKVEPVSIEPVEQVTGEITHSPIIRELENYPSPLLSRTSYKSVRTITKSVHLDETHETNGTLYLQAHISELNSSTHLDRDDIEKPSETMGSAIEEKAEPLLEPASMLNSSIEQQQEYVETYESPQISKILEPDDSTLDPEGIVGNDVQSSTDHEPKTPSDHTSLMMNVSIEQDKLSYYVATPVKSVSLSPSSLNRSDTSIRSVEKTPRVHSSPRNDSPAQLQMKSPVRSVLSRLGSERFGSKQLEIVRDYLDGVSVNLNGSRIIELLQVIPTESNRITALEVIVQSNKYQVDGFDVVRILNLFLLPARKREAITFLFGNTANLPVGLNCGIYVVQILRLLPLENHKLEVLKLMSPAIIEKTKPAVETVLSLFRINANVEKAKSILDEHHNHHHHDTMLPVVSEVKDEQTLDICHHISNEQ